MAFIRPYKETDFDACAHICIATLPPRLAASPAAAKLSPYLWTHPYTFLSPSTCHILDDGTGRAVGYCIGCPDVYAFVSRYEEYITAILSRDVARPAQLTVQEPWTIPAPSSPSPSPSPSTTPTPKVTVNPVALAQNAYRADWLLLPHSSPSEKQGQEHGQDKNSSSTPKNHGDGDGKAEMVSRWRDTMHIDILPSHQAAGWGRKLIDQFVASVTVQASNSSGQGEKEQKAEAEENYGEGVHIGIARENSKVVPFYDRVGFRLFRPGQSEGTIWMVRDIPNVSLSGP
ncbi:hypothetical protein F5Y17DRAFT_208132 [Xylariaceae sp. FL0594]|nr:hypothetical protein F5Y17DRAFT_208132 [Xylariaceae sp. FL0594]